MPDNPESPFGADTLPLDAVVPTDSRQSPSSHDLATDFAGDVLTLPAVLVPPGGMPPVGEWLNLGVMAAPARASKKAPEVPAQKQNDAAPLRQKPETRPHHPRGRTPAPRAGQDPAEAGAKQWQRMRTKEVAGKRASTPKKPPITSGA